MPRINGIGRHEVDAKEENPNKWLSITCDLKLLLRELLNRNEPHAKGLS
jgi:hypothetical protein